MAQDILTIVTDVVRGTNGSSPVDHVAKTLAALTGNPGRPVMAFDQVRGLHFARFALVDEAVLSPTETLPPQLILALVVDRSVPSAAPATVCVTRRGPSAAPATVCVTRRGPSAPPASHREACLDRVVEVARHHFDEIYAHVSEYPGPEAPNSQVRDFLLMHNVEPLRAYQGVEGATTDVVSRTADLRGRLSAALDAAMEGGGTADTPAGLGRLLREAGAPIDGSVLPPVLRRLSPAARRIRKALWTAIVAGPFLLLAAVAALVAFGFGAQGGWLLVAGVTPLAVLALALWVQERFDARRPDPLARDPRPLRDGQVSRVRTEEDHVAQNALTHCALVKPGLLRTFFLRFAFWAIGIRVRLVDRYEGSLGGIASIHFGRWMLLDKKRKRKRLLFLSDYDGSWESYLGEFVDRAAAGLSAIWSNTEGFPETCFLVGAGAKHEQQFKEWTRLRQIKTPVWYSAYPELTLANIQHGLDIAHGISRQGTPEEDRAWLALL